MKIKILFALIFALFLSNAIAQTNGNHSSASPVNFGSENLIQRFKKSVFNRLNSPAFKSENYMPVFTMLKIDFDYSGKVTSVKFSDSADSLFVKSYLTTLKTSDDDNSLLERYAKLKSYKNISIIIPINYEPVYVAKRSYYYDKMEALMKFEKNSFTGQAIILSPLTVAGLRSGEK